MPENLKEQVEAKRAVLVERVAGEDGRRGGVNGRALRIGCGPGSGVLGCLPAAVPAVGWCRPLWRCSPRAPQQLGRSG